MKQRHLVSGPFRLDLIDESLWRDGELAPLGGKGFALLRALMEKPQTLVTKDELFDRVWPGLAVSESALTTAMKDLRRALGDEARTPTVIKTVHGRGYRYLLPVARADFAPEREGESARTPMRVAIGMGAALALLSFFAAQILSVPAAGAPAALEVSGQPVQPLSVPACVSGKIEQQRRS